MGAPTPEGKVPVKLTLPGTSPSGFSGPSHPVRIHGSIPLTPEGKVSGKLTLPGTSPSSFAGPSHPWACTAGGLWQTIFRTPSLLLPHPHLQVFGNQGVGKRSVEVVAKFSCYFHASIF